MITVRESIVINRKIEEVWDFTQDYNKRPLWDRSVLSANIIKPDSPRMVEVIGRGKWKAVFRYKLERRPFKSSLVMEDVHSKSFAGGGGSWEYESVYGMTRWVQTNTLLLKPGIVSRIFKPLIERAFRRQTIRAMRRAKLAMEDKSRR